MPTLQLTSKLTLAIILCGGLFTLAHANTLQGKVVAIADGNTITILYRTNRQHRVRLAGIDAPERDQNFGSKSREHLAELLSGKQVTIQYSKLDHYGRIIGKVLVDGHDICLEQIKAGLAWHDKDYAGQQSAEDRQAYAKAEEEARAAKRGLWADKSPTPPWEFRATNSGHE